MRYLEITGEWWGDTHPIGPTKSGAEEAMVVFYLRLSDESGAFLAPVLAANVRSKNGNRWISHMERHSTDLRPDEISALLLSVYDMTCVGPRGQYLKIAPTAMYGWLNSIFGAYASTILAHLHKRAEQFIQGGFFDSLTGRKYRCRNTESRNTQ